MTRNPTPAENLRGYLRQLSPPTRGRLLAEIERLRQSGEEFPGAEFIIAELRAEGRAEGKPADQLEPDARHFFRLLDPYLTDRPPERANGAQISRASLPAIWRWIGRDLMASMARAYAADVKQFISAGKQREIEQAVQSFQNKAVKYLEGTLASAHGASQARAQLAAHGGAPASFDDLAKVLRILKARAGLAQFEQCLPASIEKLIGDRLEKTRAPLDAFAAAHADAVPFALALIAGHLAAPWQLVRLATKATETKDADEIAAAPYAIAIDIVLAWLDGQVEALRAALQTMHIRRAKQLLAVIYDAEHALRVRIELADSAWGRSLEAIMDGVAESIDSEMHNFPDGLHHVLRSRGLKQHESLKGQLIRIGWKCRDAVTGGMLYGRHMLAALRNSQAWSLFH